MPSVSHSEVESYLLCRRKHYYGYTLSLRRVRESMSLALGSAGHKILEAFYAKILAAGNSHDEQLEAFGDALEAAREMHAEIMREGFEQPEQRADLRELVEVFFDNEPFVLEGWTILAVEKQFNLEYDPANSSRYPFVVDLIVRSPKGKIVVVDHKFVYDFYSYEDSQLQPQIPKYIGALRALGFKVDYGVYNMLRTRKVTGPKMLKAQLVEALGGGMVELEPGKEVPLSKLTMPVLTEMALAQNIEPVQPPSVDQQLGWMDVKPNNTRVVRVFNDQINTAAEIQRLKQLSEAEQDEGAYRVANKMICQSCSFADICRTELVGGNAKLVLATEYTVRERRGEFDVTDDGLDDDE